MKSVEFLLNIYCEEYMQGPDKAEVTIDKKLFKRIKLLNKKSIELDVFTIRDRNCSPKFLTRDLDNSTEESPVYKEYEELFDCLTLEVSKKDAWWSGYFKDSNSVIETSMISIEELDECFKVLNCRQKNLPLLMGTLKTEKAKEIYNKRLKEA